MVVTEPGYDSKQGQVALDKLITCFWDQVEEEQVKGKEVPDYHFNTVMLPYFRAISVRLRVTKEQFSSQKEARSHTQSEKELMAHISMVGTLMDKATLIRDPIKKPAPPKEEGCWKQMYTKILVLLFSVVAPAVN